MLGYGVANPGSLIVSVFLFIAFQLQHGQCALPNSLLLFVQARGLFLGAYSFIATCFHATANAPSGSSFSLRQSPFAVSSLITRGAARHPVPEKGRADAAAVGFWVEQVGLGVGSVRVVCLLARCALPARLRWCCCSASARCLPLLGLFFCLFNWHPFGSCLCRPGATALPLGPGG